MSSVVTRFPPSPTGFFHIGSARTALFNFLFAAKEGGVMRLRFEDTDKERSKTEYEKDILDGLAWLGLSFEKKEPFRQSERGDIYRPYIQKLLEGGAAYEAEDAKDGSGKKIIRFRNPNVDIAFDDLIRGTVSFNTTDLKDFIIAKGANEPLYHLAVVIDDHEMGVTHVIRGEDHISNTPRQILILEALGFTRPQYAHIPLILAPDKTKLSKRHGAVSVNEYRAHGYLPEALINYLALLGWNPGGERELYSLEELKQIFSMEHVHKNGAVFDIEKLRWFNHSHLKELSLQEYEKRYAAFAPEAPASGFLLYAIRERARTFAEARDMLQSPEFAFVKKDINVSAELLLKGAKVDAQTAKIHLQSICDIIANLPDTAFDPEGLKSAIFPYAEEKGRGAVLWPMRTSLTNQEHSPDPFTTASILGKETTLTRITSAIRVLESA